MKPLPFNGRTFVFDPESYEETSFVRQSYAPKIKKPNPKDIWKAPEHGKLTSDMQRNKNPELGPVGHLVVDKRPVIMVPERRPRYANLRRPLRG